MKTRTRNFVEAILGLSLVGIVNAFKKGPAERVGEKIDNAVQETKNAARNLRDDLKRKP